MMVPKYKKIVYHNWVTSIFLRFMAVPKSSIVLEDICVNDAFTSNNNQLLMTKNETTYGKVQGSVTLVPKKFKLAATAIIRLQ